MAFKKTTIKPIMLAIKLLISIFFNITMKIINGILLLIYKLYFKNNAN